MKNLLLLIVLSVLTIFSSCTSDLKDEIDQLKKEKEELQKQLDLKTASIGDMEAQLALLVKQKSQLEGDKTELNTLIEQLQTMINNRYIERYINLVFGYRDNLNSYTWQHLYSDDYKLSMSIKTSTSHFNSDDWNLRAGEVDGYKTKQIIEHKYNNGVLLSSSYGNQTITWTWKDGKVTNFETNNQSNTIKYYVSKDQLLVTSSELYANNQLIYKFTYEYDDNNLLKIKSQADTQGNVVSKETYTHNKHTLLTGYNKTEYGVVTHTIEWQYNNDLKVILYKEKEGNTLTTFNMEYHTDGSYTVNYEKGGNSYPDKSIATFNAKGQTLEMKYFSYSSYNEVYYISNSTIKSYTYNDIGDVTDEKTLTIHYNTEGVETSSSTELCSNIVWASNGHQKSEYTVSSYSDGQLTQQADYKYVNKNNYRYLEYVAFWVITNGKALYVYRTEQINTYFDASPYAPKTKTVTRKISETANPIITTWTNSVNKEDGWHHDWIKDVQ